MLHYKRYETNIVLRNNIWNSSEHIKQLGNVAARRIRVLFLPQNISFVCLFVCLLVILQELNVQNICNNTISTIFILYHPTRNFIIYHTRSEERGEKRSVFIVEEKHRRYVFHIFLKFWSECFRISRKCEIHVSWRGKKSRVFLVVIVFNAFRNNKWLKNRSHIFYP